MTTAMVGFSGVEVMETNAVPNKTGATVARFQSDVPAHVPGLFRVAPDLQRAVMGRRRFVQTTAVGVSGLLAACSDGGGMAPTDPLFDQLRDCSTGRAGAHSEVKAVAFSDDGRFLVSGGVGGAENHFKLWAFPSCRLVTTLSYGGCGAHVPVAFDPNGAFAAGVLHDCIALVDLPTGDLRLERPHDSRPPGGSHSLAISPDGTMAAHGDAARNVTLWSTSDGSEIAHFQNATPNFIQTLAFSPDGSILAVGPGGYSERSEITLLSVPAAAPIGELSDADSGHTHWLEMVAFTADGRFLISQALDLTIKIWDVANRSLVGTLGVPDDQDGYRAQAVDRSGRLYGVTRNSLEVRSVPSGQLLSENTALNAGDTAGLAVTPDGRYAALGFSGRIRVWDLSSGQFFNCLYDEFASRGDHAYFSVLDASGQEIWYTLPCDETLPAGAQCTCNCVSSKPGGRSCRSTPSCGVNFTCGCIPVFYGPTRAR